MRGFTRSRLPQGWMAKAEPKGYRFISDTAVQLIGKIKADAYLLQAGGSEQDRKLIVEFAINRGERGERMSIPRVPNLAPLAPQLSLVPKPDLSWLEGGHDLPAGWKTKGDGSSRRIMAPNGKVLSGLRWFLNFMVAEGYPVETVEEVGSILCFLLNTFLCCLIYLLFFLDSVGASKDASAWVAEGRPSSLQLVLQEDRMEGSEREGEAGL